MIQNYRLTHFDQLFKPTNIKLETNKDFILLFGKSLKLTMKNSYIPITPLYSNRTENELINIDKIHQIFRKSIAKILQNHIEEDQKVVRITSVNIFTENLCFIISPLQYLKNLPGILFLKRKHNRLNLYYCHVIYYQQRNQQIKF
jgi:hypothetical protein